MSRTKLTQIKYPYSEFLTEVIRTYKQQPLPFLSDTLYLITRGCKSYQYYRPKEKCIAYLHYCDRLQNAFEKTELEGPNNTAYFKCVLKWLKHVRAQQYYREMRAAGTPVKKMKEEKEFIVPEGKVELYSDFLTGFIALCKTHIKEYDLSELYLCNIIEWGINSQLLFIKENENHVKRLESTIKNKLKIQGNKWYPSTFVTLNHTFGRFEEGKKNRISWLLSLRRSVRQNEKAKAKRAAAKSK